MPQKSRFFVTDWLGILWERKDCNRAAKIRHMFLIIPAENYPTTEHASRLARHLIEPRVSFPTLHTRDKFCHIATNRRAAISRVLYCAVHLLIYSLRVTLPGIAEATHWLCPFRLSPQSANYFSVSLTHCVWSDSDQRKTLSATGYLPVVFSECNRCMVSERFRPLIPLTVCPHSRLNVYVLMCITSLIVKLSITRVKKALFYKLFACLQPSQSIANRLKTALLPVSPRRHRR